MIFFLFLEVTVASRARSGCDDLGSGLSPGVVSVQLNCKGEAVGHGQRQEAPEEAQHELFCAG